MCDFSFVKKQKWRYKGLMYERSRVCVQIFGGWLLPENLYSNEMSVFDLAESVCTILEFVENRQIGFWIYILYPRTRVRTDIWCMWWMQTRGKIDSLGLRCERKKTSQFSSPCDARMSSTLSYHTPRLCAYIDILYNHIYTEQFDSEVCDLIMDCASTRKIRQRERETKRENSITRSWTHSTRERKKGNNNEEW